jgi:hypothetical protein
VFDFEILNFENGKPIPKLGNIWIPIDLVLEHHIKFYILGMEKLFKVGDIVIRVKHSGTMSKLLSWRLNVGSYWIQFFLKNIGFAMGFDEEGGSFALYLQ